MVNYPREAAKAAVMAIAMSDLHPHDTRDATALDNARFLYTQMNSKMDLDFHVTNFIGLHVDYLHGDFDLRNYDVCFTSSFGTYDLGKTSVTVLGEDTLCLGPHKTFPMNIHMVGMGEEIGRLTKLLGGRAPWELEGEEMREWSN